MSERIKGLPHIELPPQPRRIDELLRQPMIKDELQDTYQKAHQARTSSRDSVKPPRFRFVSEFHGVIYDDKNLAIYEGKWDDYHEWIAREHEVSEPGDTWNCIKRYTSAMSWKLRAAQNIKVLEIDTLYGFSYTDLTVMQNAGYTVMDPEHQWVVASAVSDEGYVLVPSALTWKR